MTRAKSAKPSENALVRYLRETRGELRKVTWPTRQESQRLTAIVLGVTALSFKPDTSRPYCVPAEREAVLRITEV